MTWGLAECGRVGGWNAILAKTDLARHRRTQGMYSGAAAARKLFGLCGTVEYALLLNVHKIKECVKVCILLDGLLPTDSCLSCHYPLRSPDLRSNRQPAILLHSSACAACVVA